MDGSFIDKSVTYEAEIIVGFTGELRGHYTVKFFSSTNTESIIYLPLIHIWLFLQVEAYINKVRLSLNLPVQMRVNARASIRCILSDTVGIEPASHRTKFPSIDQSRRTD